MSMKIGIRAWIDFAFRKIFGKPGNEICLISLLNAVLRFPHPVVSVEWLLGDSVTSEVILSSRSTEELESMEAHLQKRLRDRTT
jgi:hypothetical protein